MKLIKSFVAREIKNVKNRHFSFSDVFHIFNLPNFDNMQLYEKSNKNFCTSNNTFNYFHRRIL